MNINQGTIEEIKKLSISEKVLIVEEIWDDIMHRDQYPELTEYQTKELKKRIDDFNSNPTMGKSWEEIKDNLNKEK